MCHKQLEAIFGKPIAVLSGANRQLTALLSVQYRRVGSLQVVGNPESARRIELWIHGKQIIVNVGIVKVVIPDDGLGSGHRVKFSNQKGFTTLQGQAGAYRSSEVN